MGYFNFDAGDCIRYRTVVNDAVVRPWEDMPEVQPPTYKGLVDYLRNVCGIDPRPLAVAGTWDERGCYLSYGERKQFWLPVKPTDEDLAEMDRYHAVPEDSMCPICGEPVEYFEEYTMGYYPEAYYAVYCRKCDLRMTKNSKMSRLAVDLEAALKEAAKNRLVLGK